MDAKTDLPDASVAACDAGGSGPAARPVNGQLNSQVCSQVNGLAETVARDRIRILDWRDKAVQPAWYGSTTEDVAADAPPLDSLSTPMMTLDRAAMNSNLAAMRQWCTDAGVSLAPHGKTTMAPALWEEQLTAGCWAITVANEPQLRVARAAGVRRVILANLLLRPEALAWLSNELDQDEGFEFFCWVDSVAAAATMDAALEAVGARRAVNVLVEVGEPGGRTGVRSEEGGLAVAEAVNAAPNLLLSGVCGFEGSVAHEVSETAFAAVDGFLQRMVSLHLKLLGRYELPEVLLSAGGSAFFDRVRAALTPRVRSAGPAVRVVLRSGAYIVHDDGYYRRSTPQTRDAGPRLTPGMHVWARVISMPEPGVAYLDAGKRDMPVDLGLPELQLLRRREASGAVTVLPLAGHEMYATNDQHAHVRIPADSPLRVGDVVRLGLSHPCTAFDKWSLIPVLDDASAATPLVVDLVRTYF